jgi:hypothetical protein
VVGRQEWNDGAVVPKMCVVDVFRTGASRATIELRPYRDRDPYGF